MMFYKELALSRGMQGAELTDLTRVIKTALRLRPGAVRQQEQAMQLELDLHEW